MPSAIDRFADSRFGLSLALGIGRALPPAAGHALAGAVADVLAGRRRSDLVRALRANRWVVSRGGLTGAELDAAARATLRHQGRCLYDLYHQLDAPREVLAEQVRLTPAMAEWIERHRRGRSVVMAGPHLSDFDLAIVALAALGFDAQAITPPDPTGVYRRQNRWRERAGLIVTPVSLEALKAAERRLTSGGAVITGIDRPVPGAGHRPRFFGRPAELPTVHVRLAARTGAPLVVPLIRGLDDGTYEIDAFGPVPLDEGRGGEVTIANAEAVLRVAEKAIAERPEQWQMPRPVWPEALRELDALEGATVLGPAEGSHGA